MPAKLFSKNTNFNPILITSQIILVISIFYVSFISTTMLHNSFFGLQLHIDQILSSEAFDFQSTYGYCALTASLNTHIIMTIVFIVFIEKANRIFDYALTTFFLHLILTTLNSQFPMNLGWWLVNLALFAVTIVISEYISLRLDQRDITVDFKVSDKV
jgi:hypothetical protein